MANLTIRNLDDETMEALRSRSISNARSMEAEARAVLREVLFQTDAARDLSSIFREHFGPINGIDLELPEREPMPEPIEFD